MRCDFKLCGETFQQFIHRVQEKPLIRLCNLMDFSTCTSENGPFSAHCDIIFLASLLTFSRTNNDTLYMNDERITARVPCMVTNTYCSCVVVTLLIHTLFPLS